ncbi:MAG TPA: hypothetical protein PKY77_08840 [Phycisphaerae bacterium]|nr:hypothetical protein [Phycisphaerae bacterium]HRY67281.1 hypothetical protein [Phycisphaerae bacterium]HSA26349.1 hypothetical protein [Phycisphaerae bacterium]
MRVALTRFLVVFTVEASIAIAAEPITWQPEGLAGGGAMFTPAISPVDPRRMIVNCDMSAAYISHDAGRTWRMIHESQLLSNIRCRPTFHPQEVDTIFAANGWSGRLAVSRDGGETWKAIGNLRGDLIGEIAINPHRPQSMLAGVNQEVWQSQDGGTNWVRCDGPKGEAVGFCFRQAGSGGRGAILAATHAGIWRSDDDGKTWAEKSTGLPWKNLRGFTGGFDHEGKTGMLYCAIPSKNQGGQFAGGVYRSRDVGDTWESVPGLGLNKDIKPADQWAHHPVAQYYRVLTTSVRPLTVYALNANTGVIPPHQTAVYRSDDGGNTFRPTFFPDPRFPGYNVEPDYTTVGDRQYYQSIPENVAICPTDPDILIQTDSGNCIITTNGGRQWYNGHARQAKQAGFFECTGLVVTTTWHYYLDPFEPARRYICYTDIGFARSMDAGGTWRWWAEGEKAPWRNTCYELAFDPEIRGKTWGAFSNVHDIPNDNIISGRHNSKGPGGVCLSVDHGEHWTTVSKGLPEAPCTAVVLDPNSPKGNRTLYAGVFGHGVYKSTDDGQSWSRAGQVGSKDNRRVCRVQLHRDGTLLALVTAMRQENGWLADGPGLYASSDGGSTWRLLNESQPLLWPKDFAVDPADSKVVYLAAANARPHQQAGLYRTRNGGRSWNLLARKGPEHFGVALSPHHKGWIYLTLCEGAPGAGLWLSRDDGETWVPFDDLPFRNIQRVTFDPSDSATIYLATFGGSVWRGPAEPGR